MKFSKIFANLQMRARTFYVVCYALFEFEYFEENEQNDSDVTMQITLPDVVEDFLSKSNNTNITKKA